MSQDIEDIPSPRLGVRDFCVAGVGVVFRAGSWQASGGLVVAVRVAGELSQQLTGGGVDDPDVQVLD